MKKILIENKGFSMPTMVLLLMIILLLLSVVMENYRCYIIAQNVDEALQTATNMVGVENLHNAYAGLREGNSAAYAYNFTGDEWSTSVMTYQATENIKEALGLISKNGKLVPRLADNMGYSLSEIKISYQNARLAGGNNQMLSFTTSAILEIPINFMSEALPPLKLNRKVKTTFMNKF